MATLLVEPVRVAGSDGAVERSLSRAFASFAQTAQSLENSYHQLESELAKLRKELEHKNAELAGSLEDNRKVRDFLRRILEELPCGVVVAERSGCLPLVNAFAAHMLGNGRGALLRLEDLPGDLLALLERARDCGEASEGTVGTQSDAVRVIAVRHFIVRDSEQESVFLLEDVSEQRRDQKEHERLERQQAQTDLAALLAHEIRNPLGSMEVFAGLLADCGLSEEPQSWVEQLQAGLRTLIATVNNVLHFHNSPPTQPQSVDAGEILAWVGEFLRPLAKQAGAELILDNQLAGVSVLADRHRLEQVFLNLAMNALCFMPTGGELIIAGCEMNREERVIEITVSDSGPGIPSADLQRIFEAGYTTRCGSPGLGLTVCKTIVEQHGGTIFAQNRAERGTSFVLNIPRGEQG